MCAACSGVGEKWRREWMWGRRRVGHEQLKVVIELELPRRSRRAYSVSGPSAFLLSSICWPPPRTTVLAFSLARHSNHLLTAIRDIWTIRAWFSSCAHAVCGAPSSPAHYLPPVLALSKSDRVIVVHVQY
ncbi:hypothetical protein DENSPDRAFT_600774 [Dentipellis sp. KUC8613]|nr:hypothetical protein DENSPDRAFT_600774 [Dentipellis sp. KUC8613]